MTSTLGVEKSISPGRGRRYQSVFFVNLYSTGDNYKTVQQCEFVLFFSPPFVSMILARPPLIMIYSWEVIRKRMAYKQFA